METPKSAIRFLQTGTSDGLADFAGILQVDSGGPTPLVLQSNSHLVFSVPDSVDFGSDSAMHTLLSIGHGCLIVGPPPGAGKGRGRFDVNGGCVFCDGDLHFVAVLPPAVPSDYEDTWIRFRANRSLHFDVFPPSNPPVDFPLTIEGPKGRLSIIGASQAVPNSAVNDWYCDHSMVYFNEHVACGRGVVVPVEDGYALSGGSTIFEGEVRVGVFAGQNQPQISALCISFGNVPSKWWGLVPDI